MLQINPEFKKLIPALTAEEFKQLETNCLAEGIRDAIVVWNGYILDGHNRYEIANKHGLQYRTVEKHFESETDAKIWMIYNQFGRRNLNAWQRSVLVLEFEDVFKEKAKENLSKSGGDKKSGWEISPNPIIEPMETRKELAKIANVSDNTISKVKVIEAKATPEVKAQLSAGDMSINQAYKEIKQEEKQSIVAAERKAKEAAGRLITNLDIDFRLGDFETVFSDIQDGSIDCIITDPPYPKEFLECWTKLARFAKRVLKPNGFCIAYSGQMYLPEVMSRMCEHLDYYWIFSLLHTGSHQLIMGRNIFCGWKPILIFQNGFKKVDFKFDDVINGSGLEKEHHKWQQSEMELVSIFENFTNVGDTIIDPFAGGGTTAVVAKKLNRQVLLSEINEETYNVTKLRLNAR